MEPTSCILLTLDEAGVIQSLDGPIETLGLTAAHVGRDWNTVFDDWDMPRMPLAEDRFPLATRVLGPNGETIPVNFFRTPQSDGTFRVSVFFQADAGHVLTVKQQELCGLGELSADIAHETNNALTLLIGWLDLLRMDTEGDECLQPTIDLLMGEANRIARLTRNLLEVARDKGENQCELNLTGLLEEVMQLVSYEMRSSNIELQSRFASDLPMIHGSSGRLKQALLNLLINARQAMPQGGKVTVTAEPDANGKVRLAVADTGCGIPTAQRMRIFNPFFTTKENGTGLGLTVTRKIVEDHGGELELESEAGTGTRFTLLLPSGKP